MKEIREEMEVGGVGVKGDGGGRQGNRSKKTKRETKNNKYISEYSEDFQSRDSTVGLRDFTGA